MKITLKTLPQATAQQVFDQVAQHLLRQGKKSIVNGQCQYRAGQGQLACAAGCLIADDEYTAALEGKVWKIRADEGAVPEAHASLISKLQRVHDLTEVSLWPEELREIADQRGLSHRVLTGDSQL